MSLASEDKIFVKKVKNDLEGLGHEVGFMTVKSRLGIHSLQKFKME